MRITFNFECQCKLEFIMLDPASVESFFFFLNNNADSQLKLLIDSGVS